MNLTDEALKILGGKLQPSEMLALELLSEGQKMTASVTKVNLSSIICALVMELKWGQPDEDKESHSGEKPYTCPQCEKQFPECKDLGQHAKNLEMRECPQLQLSTDPENCDNTKMEIKPCECSKCDKSFQQSNELESRDCTTTQKLKEHLIAISGTKSFNWVTLEATIAPVQRPSRKITVRIRMRRPTLMKTFCMQIMPKKSCRRKDPFKCEMCEK